MRNGYRWVGGLCFGLMYLACSVSAQETAVSALSVLPTADVAERGLPPIPFSMLANLTYNKAEATRLGMTKAQQEQLTGLYTALGNESSRWQGVLDRIEQIGLKNYRFNNAVQELNEEERARFQMAAQHILTQAQRARFRQSHRPEILRAASSTSRTFTQVYPSASLRQHLANGDLLSVLEAQTVQQALEFTDEQWLRVEAARKDAYAAARALIIQLREEGVTRSSAAVTSPVKVQPLLQPFTQESMALLTEDQRKTHEQLAQAQRTEFQAAMQARRPIDAANFHTQFSLVMAHGGVRQMKSSTGPEARIEVVLHNAFASPEVIQKLALTEAQQQSLNKKLLEFQTVVTQIHNEQQHSSLQADTAQREKLRTRVQAHNAEYQTRLADLLTPEQTARLKKEVWKSVGWPALLEPEIADELKLTEEQTSAIDVIRKAPAPQMPMPTMPDGNPNDFFNRSQEFHKKMSEHQATIARKVSETLTPQQHERFEQLTGIKLVKPTTKE